LQISRALPKFVHESDQRARVALWGIQKKVRARMRYVMSTRNE
jgi:hypothetical protein